MRMKRMILPLLVLLATLSLLLAGCSGLDYMIEEYNSRFGIHDDSVLLPGDMGYDEKDMIEPEYHVYYSGDNHSLSVPAPTVKGATYLWQVFKDGEEWDMKEERSRSQQALQWDIPSGLINETFRLRLTLTVDGKTYVDEALVTVHKEVVGQ